MKTALCSICQLTGVLCSSCEEKLRRNEISQLDADASIFLGQRTKGIKEFEKMRFLRAYYINKHLVLLFQRGDLSKFLKSGKKILGEMTKKFRANAMLVEYHPSLREFVEGLFFPIPVTAVNMIWLPDGSKETRIILGRRMGKKKVEIIKKVIQKVMGVDVKVESLGRR
ncbi:MAG: hypothetical protein GTN80_00450 [Nitrososphaeria archaeon]|nr:hypothetical protein [Nitrososphaeria archaeon]NIN51630.1 hypothetical protein [Nitrososphaeria archaeon]NIQ32115.1 hypothetical protein [Nitrososphaeria archaeon]